MLKLLVVLCILPALICSAPSWSSTRDLDHKGASIGNAGPFTLTASTKTNLTKSFKNNLKVTAYGTGFNIGLDISGSYCPESPSLCPQPGTETVVYGNLQLSVEVPGGQATYTLSNGYITYNEAYIESLPPTGMVGSFLWTPFNSSHHPGVDPDCPKNNTAYDCRRGTGIITYNFNTTLGGIWACYNPNTQGGPIDTWKLFAARPDFNPDTQESPYYSDAPCHELAGLVTHPYTGMIYHSTASYQSTYTLSQ
ncbi:hypothetical protein MMC32_006728 [Xylographa parallela]|nr:hypothetical protein [Xylographa parallela]